MRLLRDLVGETLSERYRLVARIAGGGMGEVYRGHDLLLERAVAVKVLQPSLANDPDLVARFRAEARAAARLSHPNVVAVHDWGCEDERTYYMVMEYVAGTDLRDVLVGRGPLDPSHAVEISIAVCDALHAAHRTGLVHRDVKPENVLIARDGTVKVADFGIAAVADAERTLPGGSILGTLRYLSPEQASGGEATFSSDVWAAGAVLFELLTGSAPQGGSGAELLRRRAVEPPVEPSALEPDVPEALDEIVLKACAVSPRDRFDDAADMAAALRDVAATLEPRSKPVKELLVDMTDEVYLPDSEPTNHLDRRAKKRIYKRPRKTRIIRAVILAVLILLLGFGAYRAGAAIFGPQEVDVPTLVGLSRADAYERAEDAGFEIEVSSRRRDPEISANHVISQSPSDGVLLEGKTISIVVSKGPPLELVPDLVGMKLSDAEELLGKNHLVRGTVTRRFSLEYEAGRIIEQESTGKLEWGSAVDLVVSRGPQNVDVPSVVGMRAGKAEAALEDAGFAVAVIEVYSDDVEEGRVVSTTPAGGAPAPEGSEIQLAVSKGPEFATLKMPDVRGMDVSSARTKLEDMGLVVKIRQSCPGSTVIETSPIAGTTVRENDEVVLFVC